MEKQQNEHFTARKTMEEHMNVVAAANGYESSPSPHTGNEMDDKLFTTNTIVEA